MKSGTLIPSLSNSEFNSAGFPMSSSSSCSFALFSCALKRVRWVSRPCVLFNTFSSEKKSSHVWLVIIWEKIPTDRKPVVVTLECLHSGSPPTPISSKRRRSAQNGFWAPRLDFFRDWQIHSLGAFLQSILAVKTNNNPQRQPMQNLTNCENSQILTLVFSVVEPWKKAATFELLGD